MALPALSLSWCLALHQNALWEVPWHYFCPNGHNRSCVKDWFPGSWPGQTSQWSHLGWVPVGSPCLSRLRSRTSTFKGLSLHDASVLLAVLSYWRSMWPEGFGSGTAAHTQLCTSINLGGSEVFLGNWLQWYHRMCFLIYCCRYANRWKKKPCSFLPCFLSLRKFSSTVLSNVMKTWWCIIWLPNQTDHEKWWADFFFLHLTWEVLRRFRKSWRTIE